MTGCHIKGKGHKMYKPIQGFEKYSIYNDGRIMGPKGNFINVWVGFGGYLYTTISNGRASKKTVYIHRLVAEFFVPNTFNKPEVNHKDGNRLNNYYTNLEWVTRSENALHAYRMGLQKPMMGENNGLHKLTKD